MKSTRIVNQHRSFVENLSSYKSIFAPDKENKQTQSSVIQQMNQVVANAQLLDKRMLSMS